MSRYFFDIETDGFLETMTTCHSLVIKDVDTGEKFSCADQPGFTPIKVGVAKLAEAEEIIGQNIIKFDIPALEKLFGFKTKAKVLDTLVLTRLIWPDLFDEDNRRVRRGELPSRLINSHSLEAWGYRLRLLKGEYGRDEKGKLRIDAWVAWNPEMQSYCEQDVEVTEALYNLCMEKKHRPAEMAIWLEHRFAEVISLQERHGFSFNTDKAGQLYATLVSRRLHLRDQLQTAFPPKVLKETFIPKVNNKTKGYVKGQPVIRERVVFFNPSSRQMIGDRLQNDLGWQPTEFTPTGQPKVDETILSKLEYPEAKLLAEYFLVEKRIGQLAEGDQAWLKLVRNGRIHGSVNTNGAVTGRCTHSNPNVAQVPSVGAPYGAECRSLFMASTGRVLIGADLAGLELRCLAHYMARYDDGAYGKVLLEGDIHWANVLAMGLTSGDRDDSRKDHKLYRNGAKTFIYGFLYGAGDEKVGRIVYDIIISLRNFQLHNEANSLLNWFFKGSENPSEDEFKAAGKKLKKTFLKKTPALKSLREKLLQVVEDKKYLTGLDGRRLKIRSSHAALNTLLQSAGALIAKLATVLAYDELTTRGYVFGRDWALVAHVHDELQVEAKEEIADEVGQVLVDSMRRAGEKFGFRIPIDGEYKIGANWAETH